MTGRSAGVREQPGADAGEQVYCPVSGVAFTVKDDTAVRAVGGRPVFFCCEACAAHFSANEERISRLRGLAR